MANIKIANIPCIIFFFNFVIISIIIIFLILLVNAATSWDPYRQIFTVNRPSTAFRRGLRDHPAAKRAGLPIQPKTICQPGHFQKENIDADSRGVGA